MAIHANSIPAPERTLLRDVIAPGRLLPSSLPCKLGPEAEFLLLMDLKRQTEARLDELAALIAPDIDILPMSRLRGVAPGVLLYKGGRDAAR